MDPVIWAAVFIGIVMLLVSWQSVTTRRIAVQSSNVNAQLLKSNEAIFDQATRANFDNARALSTIHTLVNSNLSEAKRGELEATKRDLISMQELMSFKEAQGFPPSEAARGAVSELQDRITDMVAALKHGEQQTALAK